MSRPPPALVSSVDVLTLPKGLYLFSVRPATAPAATDPGLLLPAVQVGLAPGQPGDLYQAMSSPGMRGSWLNSESDALVAKVSAETLSLILTSVRLADMAPLQIDVKRLDQPVQTTPSANQTRRGGKKSVINPSGEPPNVAINVGPIESGTVPLRIVTHIQNRGDLPFAGTAWAGLPDDQLAIEGFSIEPLAEIAADKIEYKALSATRSETPWVGGGGFCGTRGKGLPLIGFCVRVKLDKHGKRYNCEYRGVFASGKIIGPVKNGAPCWSTDVSDFLKAIQLTITEQPARGTERGDNVT